MSYLAKDRIRNPQKNSAISDDPQEGDIVASFSDGVDILT
jgi:hypothetical protein